MNLDSLRDQDQAVTVVCPYCEAQVGEYCTRRGVDQMPLVNAAAHPARLRAAGVPDAPLDERELRRAD